MQPLSAPPTKRWPSRTLMFDLCSAPCKARRVAPPAHARGLRALTVPARSSEMGNCVMAGGVMTCNLPILSIDLGSQRRYSVVISPVQHAPLPRGTISRGTLNVVALRASTNSSLNHRTFRIGIALNAVPIAWPLQPHAASPPGHERSGQSRKRSLHGW